MKRAHPSYVKPELHNGKGPHVGSFLSKTFTIFNTESYAQYCGFSPDGEVIVIHNVHEFAAKILPRHFKHSNMQSFVRQLNMYGFRKITSEPATAKFRHPNFKRARPDLLRGIKRKSAEERKQDTRAKAAGGGVVGVPPPGVPAAGSPSVALTTKGKAPEISQMQRTLMTIWERLGRLENSAAQAGAREGAESKEGNAADIPVSTGMGVFNQTGVMPGVDLTSFPKHTDKSLNDLVSLRESLQRLQTRMGAMETEHRNLMSQNKALWEHLDIHQNRQTQLQQKLQRILMFMYQMHLQMGGNSSQRGLSQFGQSQELQLPGANSPISGIPESLFNDNIQYLCMEHPIPGSKPTASQPLIQQIGTPVASPTNVIDSRSNSLNGGEPQAAGTAMARTLSQSAPSPTTAMASVSATPLVTTSPQPLGSMPTPDLLRTASFGSLDLGESFSFDSPLPFQSLDSFGAMPMTESAAKKPRLEPSEDLQGSEIQRQSSQDFWDVLLGMNDDAVKSPPSNLPEEYKTSVAAIASNSSRLARREDQVYDTLDGLEASLSTAASISNAMAQKSDEPESTET